MKLLFDSTSLADYMFGSSCVKLGIGWYRHHKDHKWFGFTVEFYFIFRMVSITYVSNYVEYEKRMNRKYTVKENK